MSYCSYPIRCTTLKNKLNIHDKLDAILTHMSKNLDEIPLGPDRIIEKSGLNFEKAESYMMFRMLYEDGYIFSHDDKALYGIKTKGIVFLQNGGYQLQHKIYKRKMLAENISDKVNIIIKPIGILTAILVIILTTIKIFESFGLFNE